jgi:hypothetical protein
MNKQEQRIKIAEACGWELVDYYPRGILKKPIFKWRAPNEKAKKELPHYLDIPDYLNDLNAMHEAEKVLDKLPLREGWNLYIDSLRKLENGYTATASQRAEAFLRTLNLWED